MKSVPRRNVGPAAAGLHGERLAFRHQRALQVHVAEFVVTVIPVGARQFGRSHVERGFERVFKRSAWSPDEMDSHFPGRLRHGVESARAETQVLEQMKG